MLNESDLEKTLKDLSSKMDALNKDINFIKEDLSSKMDALNKDINFKMDQLNASFVITQMKTSALSAIAKIPSPSLGEEFDFGSAVPTPYSCDSNKLIMKKGLF
jgi:uncharacterized FlaG/YvyC family protein